MEFEFYYDIIFLVAGFSMGFVNSIAAGGGESIAVPILATCTYPHIAFAASGRADFKINL